MRIIIIIIIIIIIVVVVVVVVINFKGDLVNEPGDTSFVT
jgi:hypothetical protein